MRSEWRAVRAADVIEFNPTLRLPKGIPATKIAMEKLLPFTKRVGGTTTESYTGGSKFCNGDTIMARITPCLENGKTAFVDVLRDDEVGFGSTEFIVLRAKPGITNKQYIYYLAISPHFRQLAIKSMVGSSGRQRVQQSVLDDMIIELPPIEEQAEIGDCLAKLDERITLNSQINNNLLQQARFMFRRWLVDNLPSKCRLSEVASINPETYSPKDEWSFVNYLDTSNITSGTINEVQYIIPSEEKLPSRARRILRKDDVVFSTVRPNQLHYGIISNPKPNMLGSTGFAVIRSKYANIPNEIIYLALTESAFVEQMQQLAEQSVSTFPSIRPTDLDACVLPEPKESDNDFMETIKALFNAVATNNEENQRLATLRDALLPRLLSGELDVSSIDL